jgi:hypothetical protein
VPDHEEMMRPLPRNAGLQAVLVRAARRVADAEAVLNMAEETRLLARASIARSRRLLDQVEQARSAESGEPTRSDDNAAR